MKKIYENASCKVFPGFYESILYNSDTLYHFEDGYLPICRFLIWFVIQTVGTDITDVNISTNLNT